MRFEQASTATNTRPNGTYIILPGPKTPMKNGRLTERAIFTNFNTVYVDQHGKCFSLRPKGIDPQALVNQVPEREVLWIEKMGEDDSNELLRLTMVVNWKEVFERDVDEVRVQVTGETHQSTLLFHVTFSAHIELTMDAKAAQRLVESIPTLYRGPGGACALLRDGEVYGEHVWGYANSEKRIPMTKETILPICSISKQFVCLVLAKLFEEDGMAEKGDKAMRDMLPSNLSDNKDLTVERLAHMQSGIRDYWALTVLWGAQADSRFTLADDAPAALKRLGNFHFEPGMSYSYSNVNFYVLGRIAESISGKPLGKLLEEYIFTPAGMTTAQLASDTSNRPGPSVGYEGTEQVGYFPALNRIEWAGDAGIVATLKDMVAYEQYLDRQQVDDNSAYRRNAQAVTFKDDNPAFYGWGLGRGKTAGNETRGHGGALRGFRLHRRYMPDERLSAVVMFNHEADAEAANTHLLENALLNPKDDSESRPAADKGWEGAYFDSESQLAITVAQGSSNGELMVNVSSHPAKLRCSSSHEARSDTMTATLDGDVLTITRLIENWTMTAKRITPSTGADCTHLNGDYHSAEVDSTFHVTGGPGIMYGSFHGYLGKGPAYVMKELGAGVWFLSCERSPDAPAPGSWTVMFEPDGAVAIGCWLARRIPYSKL
ncbi:uncharacterized protein LTR77_007610 [Saxophila tyrrhenica]|uniref:Beta-lactamase-related domain-containing protein n=1 Tax=Saxophila tyrrhenica TaxID=1690608 RepID=A0AAV9P3C0_9PEZI|nr:hypothetical protein LTR77_007610 [Saxophila tyrrhenica]